jgi:hypothetical protein
MVDIYRKLETQLEESYEKTATYYDRKRKSVPNFTVNDRVMLD